MRRTNRLWFFSILVMMVSSCVTFYNPDIEPEDAKKYVVTGQVTDESELQTVNISVSSPINEPAYLPLTDCSVTISDDKGNIFGMNDVGNGDYETFIDSSFLLPGVSFKIEILTPSGEQLTSAFDTLMASPPLDSVYYIREDIVGIVPNNPELVTTGIQFYVDVKGEGFQNRHYRWEEVETWEYHADYPVEWWYDGVVHHTVPPDYSWKVCWSTRKIPNIFTLSTDNLTENHYEKFPLHYVSSHSSRLAYGYSLLIKQFSQSEASFVYWDQLRLNSDQPGGLYTKQPLSIRGNIINLTHPDHEVLGFFGAASVKTKRIFVYPIPDLELDFYTFCDPIELLRGLIQIEKWEYPAYLAGDEFGYKLTQLSNECVNCLLLGGTNVKPSFWPF